MEPEDFARLMILPHDLLQKYKLDTEATFGMARPAIPFYFVGKVLSHLEAKPATAT